MNDLPLDTNAQEPLAACPSCETYLAGWKRAQADYQNLTRETEQQQQMRTRYANERLLRDLLPALNQFALALSFTPAIDTLSDEQKPVWEPWLVGIRAVYTLWEKTAHELGLTPIATDGLFDPMLHEALAEELSDLPEGTITKVVQSGWILHGKVLEPAKVLVAKHV